MNLEAAVGTSRTLVQGEPHLCQLPQMAHHGRSGEFFIFIGSKKTSSTSQSPQIQGWTKNRMSEPEPLEITSVILRRKMKEGGLENPEMLEFQPKEDHYTEDMFP